MEDTQTDEHLERAAVIRAVAQEFGLPEAGIARDVYLAADWPGEVEPGAVVLAQTGKTLPMGDSEEVAQSWMKVNDRMEEQGVDLYAEVKSPTVTAFYRFS